MIVCCSKISRNWIFHRTIRVSSNRIESPNTLEFKCKSSKEYTRIPIPLKLHFHFFWKKTFSWLAPWDRPISRLFFQIFNFLRRYDPVTYYVLGIMYSIYNWNFSRALRSTSFHINASNEKWLCNICNLIAYD